MKVRNDSISDISYTTAKANATIIDPGKGIEQHGHCWSTNIEPTIIAIENITENGPANNTGPYSSIVTGLSPGTKYYVRAYVKNEGVVVYGDDILPFTTLSMDKPVVTTGTVTNITTSSATASASLNSLGAGATSVKQHGHCWSSETATPTIENDNISSLGSRDTTGNYESELVGLSTGTLYYVRAYATNDAETAYGEALSFSTDQSSDLPSVITAAISSVTATSAICGGSIISEGGSSITTKGVCWDTILNPNTSDNHTNDGTGSASFASEITGLVGNTTYYVRAYATNSVGTAYGDNVSFTASDDISIPTVTTAAADDITTTSAVSGGNVTFNGGADVTARGVCWNTTGTPTISDDKTTDGSGTGSFSSSIGGLSPGTTYYVRAYATNSEGTAYGNQISFSTQVTVSLPAVTTSAISSITETSAQGGGNVTSDGGATVTARGVCWNTTGSPTILDDNTTDGNGTGSFTSSISGLLPGTTYYVRAYATNSAGTAYGDQIDFTTTADSPTVETSSTSSVTATSAQSGGNVTSDGGATVTTRGVCWSTSSNPTISDSITTDGAGTGSFTSNITGLLPGKNYYVRAYATNSAGTAYGIEMVFTTKSIIIDWEKPLGGSDFDRARSILQTTDGDYIVAGYSDSNDGHVTGSHGSNDCWIVRLTTTGDIDWEQSLGGSSSDWAYSIQQTTDGGFIMAGVSTSDDGDVSGNHGSYDYWIAKLTSAGFIDWQKSLGGSGIEYGFSIQQTSDEGYIVAGYSDSSDGDVTQNNGQDDYWIVKLNSIGDIDWQKSLGGSGDEWAWSVQQTTDGGYVIAGYSDSNDGDVSGNHGQEDCWIVKLTSIGDIDWQKSLGGSDIDIANSIQQTTDGGYIVAGRSRSNDGDVTGNHGSADYWIVKLTSTGGIEWQKSLGGSYYDDATSIQQTTDGGYIICGSSGSIDGDVTGNHGMADYWIVKLSSAGTLEWQKSFGGIVDDSPDFIQQTTDGGYIITGESASSDGDVSTNYGYYDYWVVKIIEN